MVWVRRLGWAGCFVLGIFFAKQQPCRGGGLLESLRGGAIAHFCPLQHIAPDPGHQPSLGCVCCVDCRATRRKGHEGLALVLRLLDAMKPQKLQLAAG